MLNSEEIFSLWKLGKKEKRVKRVLTLIDVLEYEWVLEFRLRLGNFQASLSVAFSLVFVHRRESKRVQGRERETIEEKRREERRKQFLLRWSLWMEEGGDQDHLNDRVMAITSSPMNGPEKGEFFFFFSHLSLAENHQQLRPNTSVCMRSLSSFQVFDVVKGLYGVDDTVWSRERERELSLGFYSQAREEEKESRSIKSKYNHEPIYK